MSAPGLICLFPIALVKSKCLCLGLLLAVLGPAAFQSTSADSVVVFNEIMYHPLTDEPTREWVELHNQMAVNVELSGWSVSGGIQFQFAEGTIIPGGGYLVVAAAPAELITSTGLTNVLGPFAGRLSNSGDKLELRNNNGRLMDEVVYGVEGEWPVGPNGSGASLAKRDEDSASPFPSSWTVSALVGGTPGGLNFAAQPFVVTSTTPIPMAGSWRYAASRADLDVTWRQPDFDDSRWDSGTALLGDGNASPAAGNLQLIPSVFSSGVSDPGTVLAPGSADPHYLLIQSAQGTPPPPPIGATVIQNHPAWAANDTASSWIGVVNPGTTDVPAGSYNYRTRFNLDGFKPETARLTISVGADNRLTSVLLNGVSKNISYIGFAALSSSFTITNGFNPGPNTLDFLTANDGIEPNPAGFRALLRGMGRKQLEVKTTLSKEPTSYYFRSPFILKGSPQLAELQLETVVADGAVFYLNGNEVLRLNMPSGPIQASTLAISNTLKPAVLGPLPLSNARLLTGTNVLAVEVHRGPNPGSSLLFGAGLSLTTTNILAPPAVLLALNEISSATNADFWVELMNYGSATLDLAGCVLARQGGTTNREYVFPSWKLAPADFGQVTRATLGFGADPGDRLFLYSPGRRSVLDAVVAKRVARGRWPDGIGRWWYPTALTPAASNHFVIPDSVVINEIMYHAPPSSPGSLAPSESWLELYNRSSRSVDLAGWRLLEDMDYEFPAGTTVPAGGYLVVAKDVASMLANHPGIGVVGPFNHDLHHKSSHVLLLDPVGNPADEVQFFDSKPWPEYAGGGGSSLELRDPGADNSKPEAWAASLESVRSGWSNYTYRAVAGSNLGPTQWKEFVIGLLDSGECLVDNLSVVENPSGTPVQLLQNGNFETGLASWRALGNHSRSRVEVDPDNADNRVLHLVATGPTEHMHNHLETTLANGLAVVNGREYQISFRARWLAGNNRFNTRLYFNRVAKTTVLPVSSPPGTPGTRNSTFATNIGPTFASFGQSPVVPKTNEKVTVSVNASDPQGISAITLYWSTNQVAWNTSTMLPGHPSAEPGYTNYTAVLAGQPAGTLVQFYIRASDALGTVACYPAAGANSRALFKIDDGKPLLSQLHRFRLLMTPADADRLHAPTNVMSNDHLGLTMVYDERRVFYDVGVHLQGSERGRNNSSRVGFTVRLNSDQRFRGVQPTVTIDRSGGYSNRGGRHDEILLWHAVNHAGGLLGLDCDLVQCFAPRTQEDSTGMLRMSAFDANYFDAQYSNGAAGQLYKLELIYYPTTTLNGNPQSPKLPQPDEVINVELQNWGNDPENYRWIFRQENHADQDDYRQLIALNKACSLAGTLLESQTTQLMVVDEWMRALAFKAFTGDVDTFTYGLNHNWAIYFRPSDAKALGLLWDMDYSFAQSVDYASPGRSSANTYKITRLPNNNRRFYSHLLDLSTTTINAAYLQPWAAHYAGLLGQNWSGLVSYLEQRAKYLRRTMPLTTPFAITSNSGKDFATSSNRVTLTGTAPLTLDEFTVNGVRFPVTWTSVTNWVLAVPLSGFANLLVLQGLDHRGNPLTNATDAIIVTNINAPVLQPVVINEWMAENSPPGGFLNPIDSRYADWFELYNPNPVSVDLAGYFLTDTLSRPDQWKIPTNTVIAPNGFLLVWADNGTPVNGMDTNGDLHVSFQLSKNGDALGLYGPDGSPQHTLVFGAQAPDISQGFFPDGNTNIVYDMPNWTPHAANQLGEPPWPKIRAVTVGANGTVSFVVSAIPGRTYRVEYVDVLGSPDWIPLDPNLTAHGPSLTIIDAIDRVPQRFYRVSLLP